MHFYHVLFHIITYYVAWFACVLSAAHNHPWLGAGIALFIFVLQYLWQRKNHETKGLLAFVALLGLSGFLLDSLFLNLGIIYFLSNPWHYALSPPWMIMLWVNFAVLLYACLRYLFNHYFILGGLAFVGFPLAYWAGILMKAAVMPLGLIWLSLYGIAWGIGLPTLIYLYQNYMIKDIS